jgi:hypothetical protein
MRISVFFTKPSELHKETTQPGMKIGFHWQTAAFWVLQANI